MFVAETESAECFRYEFRVVIPESLNYKKMSLCFFVV